MLSLLLVPVSLAASRSAAAAGALAVVSSVTERSPESRKHCRPIGGIDIHGIGAFRQVTCLQRERPGPVRIGGGTANIGSPDPQGNCRKTSTLPAPPENVGVVSPVRLSRLLSPVSLRQPDPGRTDWQGRYPELRSNWRVAEVLPPDQYSKNQLHWRFQ